MWDRVRRRGLEFAKFQSNASASSGGRATVTSPVSASARTFLTTLTDPEVDSKEEIAELYGFRWNVELEIRSIKQSLNLGHARCKSPEMVRKELWTTILGYKLIRTTVAAAR